MLQRIPKKICFEDAFKKIVDGNESEVEDLSSDEDGDDVDYVGSDHDCNDYDDNSYDNNSEENRGTDTGDTATQSNKKVFRWRKKDLPPSDESFHLDKDNIEEIKSPLEYFRQFWPDEINDLVVEQTNLYSTQKSGTSINTTKPEMEQFIGMHLKMGLIQLPSYKLYWSQKMRYPAIADPMPLKRYEKLRSNLHFVDNSVMEENVSKLSKIQPVIDIVREQCLKVIPEESHSVDEQIIPAKTKYSGIHQYNPKKPVKWGFKNLVRAGASGFMYDFYIYAGKDEIMKNSDFKHLQKSAQVVAQLCQHLPSHSGHQLFFDNWFTTLDLLIYLKNRGILACGTMRANRIQGCPLQTNKDMNKAGRGAIDFKSDAESGIVVVKWLDNNAVHIASNYVGVEPLGAVERWSPTEKKRMNIQCPQVILRYNKGMGGVDLADMFISLYRINMKTRRWYIKIFWHLVDIAKVNAWILYRRHRKQLEIPKKQELPLLDFVLEISEGLISSNKVVQREATSNKQGRPSKRRSSEEAGPSSGVKVGRKPSTPLPSNDTRYDQLGHWPNPTKDNRSRCRFCKDGFSKIFCSKCKVYLCLREGKNCFVDYHRK